jgi:hypothetical protein
VDPFADNRLDCFDLLQRNVIHHETGKASGISSWYSCQTNRLRTICSKRQNSIVSAPEPILMGESNLKPWANVFMVKAIELDVKLQNRIECQLHRLLARTGVTTMVVKNRAPPPGSWKWQIYRAGRSSPVKQSSVYFSHHGDRQSGRKRGAQAAIGQAPCKQSGVRSYSASATGAKCAIEQLRD